MGPRLGCAGGLRFLSAGVVVWAYLLKLEKKVIFRFHLFFKFARFVVIAMPVDRFCLLQAGSGGGLCVLLGIFVAAKGSPC